MSEHFVPVSPREVMVTTAGLQAMRKQWPCSGLPYKGYCVIFEFAQNGDLVDVKWHTDEGLNCSEPEGINGECLVALSKDAESFVEDWPAWRTRRNPIVAAKMQRKPLSDPRSRAFREKCNHILKSIGF